MYTCPRNHASETADYCSVCGIAIPEGPARDTPPVGSASAAPTPGHCPECGAVHEMTDQAVCPICGFNFQTKASEVPALRRAPAGDQPQWNVVVTVDANLFGKSETQAPVDHPPQVFTLFEVANYVGRGGADVRVHVPVTADDAVSRRQAVLTRRPDGGLTVRDLGSANGTFLNGKPLTPGVDTSITDGDMLAMGAWTRIILRKVT
jgi:hypothetical protein